MILPFKVALDDATIENGCMWFVPGSNKLPLREHHPAGKGSHVLECPASEVYVYIAFKKLILLRFKVVRLKAVDSLTR